MEDANNGKASWRGKPAVGALPASCACGLRASRALCYAGHGDGRPSYLTRCDPAAAAGRQSVCECEEDGQTPAGTALQVAPGCVQAHGHLGLHAAGIWRPQKESTATSKVAAWAASQRGRCSVSLALARVGCSDSMDPPEAAPRPLGLSPPAECWEADPGGTRTGTRGGLQGAPTRAASRWRSQARPAEHNDLSVSQSLHS